MIAKKILSPDPTPKKMTVDTNRGLLQLEYDNQTFQLIELKDDQNGSTEILKSMQAPKKIKYIGGRQLLKLFKSLKLHWPRIDREIVINDPTSVIYHPRSGRVQFAKEKGPETNSNLQKETKKRKVLIVDDSPTIQKLLSRIISESEELEVSGIADRPSEAQKLIEANPPDIITLDIHMPEMTGVEFLKTYLGKKGIPTVIISSISQQEGPLVMEALAHGAMTYIQKPNARDFSLIKSDIYEKLSCIKGGQNLSPEFAPKASNVGKFNETEGMIVIGSSTGGTQALEKIFLSLPEKIPPVLVVQHIPAVFSKALAERLNRMCRFRIKEAVAGEVVESNTIYIAPGGFQMSLEVFGSKRRIAISDDPPVNRFKPSVDYLFHSISKKHCKNIVGVILTGMGRDGAQGLLHLKTQGAKTIAQDEKSCVVFGMPKEAIKLNAAEKIVPLHDMARQMVKTFNSLEEI